MLFKNPRSKPYRWWLALIDLFFLYNFYQLQMIILPILVITIREIYRHPSRRSA